MTVIDNEWSITLVISTHTLRKEGDYSWSRPKDIYKSFQPTPSARRVTMIRALLNAHTVISTHTLRKEGDQKHILERVGNTIFQPTPSARRVT